ncbi:MAG: LysR family transcriptional regulator, partial [Gammaproteobacteria bacterium]|nr:LysR family transcriptional regulator [Gammaproteobacteria bacterium]
MSQTQKINRFKYIEALSAVISCGSISAAAKQLNVSQPAVSQLIKKLEDSVGVPLFVRRNGVIYPTARAESLRDDVDDLLLQLDKVQMQLNLSRSSTISSVRFTASMSIVNELLPKMLAQLHKQKPSISFYVNSLPLASMTKAVMDGNVDFSITTKPLNNANIVTKQLVSAREVCVLPIAHPLAQKKKLSIRDLKNQKMMMTSRTDNSYDQHRKLFHNHRVQYKKLL